jgi:hypothetical protein
MGGKKMRKIVLKPGEKLTVLFEQNEAEKELNIQAGMKIENNVDECNSPDRQVYYSFNVCGHCLLGFDPRK